MSLEKEFIHYEQALALKELGFDKPCLFSYDYWNTEHLSSSYYDYVNYNAREKSISAPLYQQAFKFLLDINEDIISITYFFDGSGNLKRTGEVVFFDFNNREDCLIELINLVKLKKQ